MPVLACLGADAGGTVLNINADVVASQLAGALRAGALVACTAVGGVRRDKDDPATRLARLTVARIRLCEQILNAGVLTPLPTQPDQNGNPLLKLPGADVAKR